MTRSEHHDQLQKIKSEKNMKFLGVHLSLSGSAKIHIDSATSSITRNCSFLKILSCCKFGVKPSKALHFYKAFVRPKIEYDASAISNSIKTSEQKL